MAIFKSDKKQIFNPQEINIINAGTSIVGDISSEGDLRIDGLVKGNITVKSKLVLGASSKVEGNVKATNCDVQGTVNGNIIIEELLSVKATAKIIGDITSQKLIIESGAEFNGHSKMGMNQSESKTSNGTQKPTSSSSAKAD
ncbi:MAG: polymer-forming cytoskeletal protein [Candidatus Methylacidiphilales bacterium]